MSLESSYLDHSVALLQSLLDPDSLGNSGVLRIHKHESHPVVKLLQSVKEGASAFPPPSGGFPNEDRNVVADIGRALYPHVTGAELAVFEVSKHSYSCIPYSQTLRAISIHLFHKPREVDFLTFKPKHTHYKDLALSSEIIEADR